MTISKFFFMLLCLSGFAQGRPFVVQAKNKGTKINNKRLIHLLTLLFRYVLNFPAIIFKKLDKCEEKFKVLTREKYDNSN